MKKLLEMAKKVCDQAEVYSHEHTESEVDFTHAELHDIKSKIQSGVALRIIKDGKMGFAYTRNLINREELLKNALDSLKGKVEANYDFPLTENLPKLNTYDNSIENLFENILVEECSRICEILKSETDGEIEFGAGKDVTKIRIINTSGTDVTNLTSSYGIGGSLVFPGGATGVTRVFSEKKFQKTPDNILNEMISLYNSAKKIVEPRSGKMKVLFMPFSIYTLTWRINSGTSAMSIYEKISPIADKIGKKIFDDKFTLYDDPLNDKYPGASAFDDEGVACKTFTLIENGVLKSFYYDLNYAKKLNAKSTGHGYRTIAWGGDPITLKPVPSLQYLYIKPGNKTFRELVKMIDKGIILDGVMGAHSGNIPNGDYSVGVSPAFYVENGEIVGRVKDAMVAGNVYETLKNIVAIEDTVHDCWIGRFPAILCDNVSVATKK